MRSVFAVMVALQAVVVSAFPGVLEQRQEGKCNADNCLRQVRNTKSMPRGSTDCQSYFGIKTIVPCAVTVPGTSTVTAYSVTVTITTQTRTTTQIATSTVLSTITVTSTAGNLDRRLEEVIEGPTCPTTVTGSAAVPSYASSCATGTRYSSACSCIGVTAGTVTMGTTTTVVSGTVTATVTSAGIFTQFVQGLITETSTAIVTSTVTSTITTTNGPPSCQTFAITYDGTNPAGTGNNFNRDFTTGTVTLGDDSPLWYLQNNGKLTPLENEGQGIVLSQFESSGQPFDRMNVDSDPQPKNLQCSVAGGVLTCTGSNGIDPVASDEFYLCPQYSDDQFYASGPGTVYISDGTSQPDGCMQLTLTATAQC